MISELLLLILLIGIFLFGQQIYNDHQKRHSHPGPWGLPLLGNLISLRRDPHLKLMKWKKKYGPIIRCRIGSFPSLVLGDAKVIKEAFNMPEFAGRLQLQLMKQTKAANGIVFSEGPYNLELRQFSIRKLKEFGVGKKLLEDQIHQGVAELLEFIKMREGLPIKSENVPSSHVIRTLWLITMTYEMDQEKSKALEEVLKMIVQRGPILSELANFMPWLENMTRIVSLGHFSLISSRLHQLNKFVSFFAEMMEEKKRERLKTHSQVDADIMDFFLAKMEQTTDTSSPFHPSHDCATFLLMDLFVGGLHTTHITLLWLFNYMARNPEKQYKLQEEIENVIGNFRLPTLVDRVEMPYADAVIHEVLRMGSVVPLAIPHNATADALFRGYKIKKGTRIFANVYGVHHDPEIWGDPLNFRPERWFGDSGKKLKKDHFLAFSTNRRNCVGEALARDQLFLYLTTLFQKYTVEFPLGELPEVKGVFGMTLEPSEFTVVFKHRQSYNKIQSKPYTYLRPN